MPHFSFQDLLHSYKCNGWSLSLHISTCIIEEGRIRIDFPTYDMCTNNSATSFF